MNNKRKEKKIAILELEIQVKDKIIANMVKFCADKKYSLPKDLVDIIAEMYGYKMPEGKRKIKFRDFLKNKRKKNNG